MLVPVRFLRSHTPYTIGEVAGFDRSESEKLVKSGYAEYYIVEEEKEEEEPKKRTRQKLGDSKEMNPGERKRYVTK